MRVFVDASLLIYLNVPLVEDEAAMVEDFWRRLVEEHELYTNVLVLDEVIYISEKKYRISAEDTLEFIESTAPLRGRSTPGYRGVLGGGEAD